MKNLELVVLLKAFFHKISFYRPVIAALIIIAIGFGILDFYTPAFGDDLSKWNDLGLNEYHFFKLSTFKYIGTHYLTCNGRILDSVGPIITFALPRLLASILMGVMAAFYFLIVLKASDVIRPERVSASMLIILTIILAMPWWDSMWLRVCQFSYMWPTAFCILFFVLFTQKPVRNESFFNYILYIALGVITGFSHEQSGLSACCGVFAYWVFINKFNTLNRRQIILTVSLIFGLACVLVNPMLWSRFESSGSSLLKVRTFELVTTTLPLLCLMIIVVFFMIFSKKQRTILKQLSENSWIIYVALALAGGAIAIFSRTIGRTGFLPETASIIALALIVEKQKYKITKPVAVLCSTAMLIAVTIHFIIAISLQIKLNDEYNDVLRDYIQSEDGIVYYDITTRRDFPLLALNHAQGVPDADDMFLLSVMNRVYRNDSVPLTVLPSQFKGRLDKISDSLIYNNVTVYRSLPNHFVLAVDETGNDTVRIVQNENSNYILKPLATSSNMSLWVSSPLIVDKGDHWFVINNP